jgi:hypothetical protein
MLATPEPDSSDDEFFTSPSLNPPENRNRSSSGMKHGETWGTGELSVWGDFREMGLGQESFEQETPRASGASTPRNLSQ